MAPTSVPVLDSGMPETRPSAVVEGLDLLPWSFRVSGMKLSELSLKGGEMHRDTIFLIWWTNRSSLDLGSLAHWRSHREQDRLLDKDSVLLDSW